MRQITPLLALVFALALLPMSPAAAQDVSALDARQRVFPEIGPGFRTIRRGPEGHYYVLVAPGVAVGMFDAAGEKLGQIPPQPAGLAAIVGGAALDVDASGRVYVADWGGNAVKIYAPDGSLALHLPVAEPTGVAALPGGEFAVSSLRTDNLITVYDSRGTLLRTFGGLAELADSPNLNRRLNLGHLLADTAGNIYYAFEYFPEPTVRKYDPAGYLTSELSLTTIDFQSPAQAARREIARAKTGATIVPRQIISAVGIAPDRQELWLAFGNLLMRFDREGHPLFSTRTFTPSGARLEPRSILVEPDRLLLGNDPLGIYAVLPPNLAATPR